MKTLSNGQTVEVLRVYKNASKLQRENNGTHYDLLKVMYSDGKEDIICSSEISS